MAAPTHVQSVNARVTSTDTNALAYGSNLGTASLLVAVICSENGSATFGITDSRGHTWTQAVRAAGASGRVTEIWYVLSSTAGANTVTALASAAIVGFRLALAEFSYTGTVSLDRTSSIQNNSLTTHPCAAAGDIDTSTNVVVIAAGTSTSTNTGTKNANYTNLGAASSRSIQQYRESATALTNEDAAFTFASSTDSACAIASFTLDAVSVHRLWVGML